MENRNGLLIDFQVNHATGIAERESALSMLSENVEVGGATVAGDKATTTAPGSGAPLARTREPSCSAAGAQAARGSAPCDRSGARRAHR